MAVMHTLRAEKADSLTHGQTLTPNCGKRDVRARTLCSVSGIIRGMTADERGSLTVERRYGLTTAGERQSVIRRFARLRENS